MDYFYQHLADNKSGATALSQAKLDYLRDKTIPSRFKTPYYWAGFVYVGVDEVVELALKKTSIWWILAGFLAFGVIIMLIKPSYKEKIS